MSELLSEEYLRLAVMAGLVVLSAFFSGSETALFSLGREELDSLRRRHPRRGAVAAWLLAAPEDLLTSILFGNLVVNMLYFSLGAGLAARASVARGSAAGAGVGVVVLVLLVLFGEILPKALAAGSTPSHGMTTPDAYIKVRVESTIYYIPIYTSITP